MTTSKTSAASVTAIEKFIADILASSMAKSLQAPRVDVTVQPVGKGRSFTA